MTNTMTNTRTNTMHQTAAVPAWAIDSAARMAHEVNRAYCASMGDASQVPWAQAPEWQRDSSRAGVVAIVEGRIQNPGDAHRLWCEHKEADGWTHGPVKDAERKQHPCLVPFTALPASEQIKDHLFVATVRESLRASQCDDRVLTALYQDGVALETALDAMRARAEERRWTMERVERELRLRIAALRDALSRVRGDFRDEAMCSGSSYCKHCIAREALEEDERAALTAASEATGGRDNA